MSVLHRVCSLGTEGAPLEGVKVDVRISALEEPLVLLGGHVRPARHGGEIPIDVANYRSVVFLGDVLHVRGEVFGSFDVRYLYYGLLFPLFFELLKVELLFCYQHGVGVGVWPGARSELIPKYELFDPVLHHVPFLLVMRQEFLYHLILLGPVKVHFEQISLSLSLFLFLYLVPTLVPGLVVIRLFLRPLFLAPFFGLFFSLWRRGDLTFSFSYIPKRDL